MKTSRVLITVEYPIALANEVNDALVRKAIGVDEDGSGGGFGIRDLTFSIDATHAWAASDNLRVLQGVIPKLTYSISEPF